MKSGGFHSMEHLKHSTVHGGLLWHTWRLNLQAMTKQGFSENL